MKGFYLFTLFYWSLASYAGIQLTAGEPVRVKSLAIGSAVVVFWLVVLAWRRFVVATARARAHR